jgi:hydrogenase maturation protease
MRSRRSGVVVIGIGNIIRSDDGFGVHAVRCLRQRKPEPAGVELIEGGTAGLLLLPHLASARRAIIIDAINSGAPAGTLVRLPHGEGAFATGITPHDVGLADLLDAARLSDAWPDELVLHGVQPGSTELGTELTPPVVAALEPLVDTVAAELAAWQTAAQERGDSVAAESSRRVAM